MDCSTPGLPVHHHLPGFAQVHVHCTGDAARPPHPLTPSSPSALNLPQPQGLSQWVICLHQITKILELQHQSFQWIFRVISLKINWFDLLAVQGTFRSLLQHHSSKASILCLSAFFTVQLSQPYVTSGKTTALTRWTFVGRVTSLLFNTLSRFVIAFLPRSKHFLISWLKLLSSGILEPKKRNQSPTYSPSICHEVMGPDAMTFIFWM